MQCKEVEVVLEQEGFVPVPEAARAHLAGCSSCQNLIADLTAIVATAHESERRFAWMTQSRP